MKISISLCLPAFNEEKNVKKAIDDSVSVLHNISNDWEIIVIDDGSFDNTAQIVKRMAESDKRIRLIRHGSNRGYGAALTTGFYSAKKKWIWLSPSDNQFDPQEIHKLLPFADSYDIIVGYRINRQDPLYRRIYGILYNKFITLLFGLRVKDINCGFKLIKKNVFDEIELKSTGAIVDAEFIIRCKKAGFTLKQTAVAHKPRQFEKHTGGNIEVIIRMFIEAFRLKTKERL